MVEPILEVERFIRLYLDVTGGALDPSKDLVDHDPGVGQGQALARGASRQEKGSHGGRQAHADRLHVRLHMPHGVVNGEAVIDGAARGIDVKANVLLGILCLQHKELLHDVVGGFRRHLPPQKDNTIPQEP